MKEIGRWISNNKFYIRGNILLELGGIVVLDMEENLSLHEVAAQIGQALGITFSEDVEGIYEETYALTAKVLNQVFAVYREDADSPRPYAGRIVLEVLHWVDPWGLDLKKEDYIFLRVNVAEHLAALLRKKTGLPFVAHRPVPGEL